MDWLSYLFVGCLGVYLTGTVVLESVDRFWPDHELERFADRHLWQIGMQALFLVLLVSGVLRLFI